MELVLTRNKKTDKSTIGDLQVNGKHECYILEDADRGLSQDMPLDKIKEKKVYGATAIPAGRYQVIMTYSEHFKKYLPLLLNVPGYAGVRIHSGNVPADTLGCLLTGSDYTKDTVTNSRDAFISLYAKMAEAEKKEKIFITIH